MRTDLYERSLKKYIKEKEDMIVKDFKIRLSKAEKDHLYSLTTEISVDNFVRDIIRRKL